MNAKLLFAATLAVSALSLASTVAMAADATGQSQASQGGERLGQLYTEPAARATPSTASRAAVISALAADRVDHPYGDIGQRDEVTAPRREAPSFLARAEVKADVRHAIAEGRLPRNGENDESVTTASAVRAAQQHIALASR